MNVLLFYNVLVAEDLMKWVNSKKLKFSIHKIYDLNNASEAHDDLEGKRTTGKLVLRI